MTALICNLQDRKKRTEAWPRHTWETYHRPADGPFPNQPVDAFTHFDFFPFLENTDVNGGVASNYHNARLKDANDADNIKSDLKDQTQITFSSSLNTGELI